MGLHGGTDGRTPVGAALRPAAGLWSTAGLWAAVAVAVAVALATTALPEPLHRAVVVLLATAAGVVGLVATAAGRRRAVQPPRWPVFGVGMSAAALALAYDVLAGGDTDVVVLTAVLAGAGGVGFGLVPAMALHRAEPEDWMDVGLIATSVTYVTAWHGLPRTASGGIVSAALVLVVLLAAGVVAMILVGARARGVGADRAVVAAGLGSHLVATALHLGAGRDADRLTTALLLLGSLLIAIAVVRVGRAGLAVGAGHGRRDAAWWIPMTSPVGVFAGYVGMVGHPEDAVDVSRVLIALAGSLLCARIVLTIRRLTRVVDEVRRDREALALIARTDSLTGLANRGWLADRLEGWLAPGTAGDDDEVCLLFCDLDRLKVVNDGLGYGIGDALIRQVARRWQQLIGPEVLSARVGGDEFAFALRGPAEQAEALAQRLHASLERPIGARHHRLSVSTSIGITVGRPGRASPDSLLRDADVAMYRAKAVGGGTTRWFDEAMHHQALRRLQLERELRQALVDGSVEVHLQPIVALADQRVAGVEALLRWTHPDMGRVAPDEVIDLAEETGLIVPLGRHILFEACAALTRVRAAGHDVPSVAVNTSASQLVTATFTQDVADALATHGLDAGALTIEVTEGVLLDDGTAAETLDALRAMGVKVSLDDFGTGYSSLSYLATFALDQLKLDRSFLSSDERGVVVGGILRIAHDLGLPVVAEGVETRDQADRLHAMGCALVQGWAYTAALAVPALLEWLEARQAAVAEEPVVLG